MYMNCRYTNDDFSFSVLGKSNTDSVLGYVQVFYLKKGRINSLFFVRLYFMGLGHNASMSRMIEYIQTGCFIMDNISSKLWSMNNFDITLISIPIY